MLTYSILSIIAGLALLVWSADRFIYGAAAMAKDLGVSSMIIGITIVGFGTSAPEMLVSSMAAIGGNPGLGIGNALGSNIANILLILGFTALIIPLGVDSRTLRHEFPILLVVMLATWWLLSDGELGRMNGITLVFGLFLVMAWLIYDAMHARPDDPMLQEFEDEIPDSVPMKKAIFWFLLGLGVLLVSSRMLVWGSVNIAEMMGISDLVIGLTIVAIGTSLPELAASIASALKNESDLAVGNVIGSNLFNTLGVLALPGLIHPSMLEAETLSRDIPVMVGATVLLFIFGYKFRGGHGRINRFEGGLLLACFVAYQFMIFNSIRAS